MIRVFAACFVLSLLITPVRPINPPFQEFSYTNPKAGFTIQFPSGTWRNVGEPDDVHQHTEFIYGDRNDGYLRIRKEPLDEGLTVQKFAEREQDQRTRFLPGFVDGKSEAFNG